MKPSQKKERKKASKLAQSLSNVKDVDLTCPHKAVWRRRKLQRVLTKHDSMMQSCSFGEMLSNPVRTNGSTLVLSISLLRRLEVHGRKPICIRRCIWYGLVVNWIDNHLQDCWRVLAIYRLGSAEKIKSWLADGSKQICGLIL